MPTAPVSSGMSPELAGGCWHDHGTYGTLTPNARVPNRHTAQVELEFGDVARYASAKGVADG
jgi:hypothetical protein